MDPEPKTKINLVLCNNRNRNQIQMLSCLFLHKFGLDFLEFLVLNLSYSSKQKQPRYISGAETFIETVIKEPKPEWKKLWKPESRIKSQLLVKFLKYAEEQSSELETTTTTTVASRFI